jgi:hypothetical protein
MPLSDISANQDSLPAVIPVDSATVASVHVADTATMCIRNGIADFTFYDSTNLLKNIYPRHEDRFPVLFTEKNRIIQDEAMSVLVKHLKPGTEVQLMPLHDDWIILIILVLVTLSALIRRSSTNILHGVERFFLFKGIGEPGSRDTGGLLNWDATIKNLLSFLVLGLFGFAAASGFDAIPPGFSGIVIWLIAVLIIIMAVTLRHMVCLITGYISDQREVFLEYIMTVYQFYRFSALVIFVVIILMLYTTIFTVGVYFTAGVVVMGVLYLIRILRLLLIFINRSISLFYFILYLCALEILPVVISVKYISGYII